MDYDAGWIDTIRLSVAVTDVLFSASLLPTEAALPSQCFVYSEKGATKA